MQTKKIPQYLRDGSTQDPITLEALFSSFYFSKSSVFSRRYYYQETIVLKTLFSQDSKALNTNIRLDGLK